MGQRNSLRETFSAPAEDDQIVKRRDEPDVGPKQAVAGRGRIRSAIKTVAIQFRACNHPSRPRRDL
jgi:hypothetical protein